VARRKPKPKPKSTANDTPARYLEIYDYYLRHSANAETTSHRFKCSVRTVYNAVAATRERLSLQAQDADELAVAIARGRETAAILERALRRATRPQQDSYITQVPDEDGKLQTSRKTTGRRTPLGIVPSLARELRQAQDRLLELVTLANATRRHDDDSDEDIQEEARQMLDALARLDGAPPKD